jgi:cytochrome P450
MSSTPKVYSGQVIIPNENLKANLIYELFRSPHSQRRKRVFNSFRQMVRFYHWSAHDLHQGTMDALDHTYKRLNKLTVWSLQRHSDAHIDACVRQHVNKWLERTFRTTSTSTEANLVDEVRAFVVHAIVELAFDDHDDEPHAEYEIFYKASKNFINTIKGVEYQQKWVRQRALKQVRRRVASKLALDDSWSQQIDDKISVEHLAIHFLSLWVYSGVTQCVELIVHTLAALAQHEHVKEKLVVELASSRYEYLDMVIKETNRVYPLFGRTTRDLSETIRVRDDDDDEGEGERSGGTTFMSGTHVIIDIQACQMSEKWGKRANEFVPERWDKANKYIILNYIQIEYEYDEYHISILIIPILRLFY